MQSQSENIDIREQLWNAEEIRQLIEYARSLEQTNEDLRAGIITIQAKLDNEEAKVKRLTMYIAHLTNVNSQM